MTMPTFLKIFFFILAAMQVTKTTIKTGMSLKFSQIPSPTMELAAL